MATYTGTRAQTGIQPKYNPTGVVFERSQYSASATLSVGDIIQMIKVQAGAKLANGVMTTNEDTKTVQNTYAIGDGVDTDRYFASATVVPSSFAEIPARNVGNTYEYTAADTIDIRVENLGGTGGATVFFTLTALIDYTDDDPASH